jgi:glycosyltransferase involved in cell wall biosynthesis
VRIVVDARTVTANKSGIGNYVEALLKHMVPMAEDARFLLLRRRGASEPILRHPRVEELETFGETKSLHTHWIGRVHRFEEFDLFHGPADLIPPGIRCPWVVTTHDMMWIERPELASAFAPVRLALSTWYRAGYSHAIRGAQRVIAISRSTASGIGRVFPTEASKVRVVHHGIDRTRYDPAAAGPRSVIERIVPASVRYSLIIGQGSPYKNHYGMIRAFVEATAGEPDHKLVLVRRFARVDRGMRELLERPDVKAKVIAVPFVTDAELLALYKHAVALLFASHYEGFGMPALEAMAMDLPVLASTFPAVEEVTGNAALAAVSTDHADLVAKIRILSGDADLRARLAQAGRERASAFSWEACAQKTLEVYREAIQAAKSRS